MFDDSCPSCDDENWDNENNCCLTCGYTEISEREKFKTRCGEHGDKELKFCRECVDEIIKRRLTCKEDCRWIDGECTVCNRSPNLGDCYTPKVRKPNATGNRKGDVQCPATKSEGK